jgi:hypothetical protein
MNLQLFKILKTIDSDIISAFIERNKLCFLLCVHRSGYLFFIDVSYYNIDVQDNTSKFVFIKRLNTQIDLLKDSTLQMYQQLTSEFPKYMSKLVYFIDSTIVVSMNTIYKILDPDELTKLNVVFLFYDLSTLVNNKISFQEDLMLFKENLQTKLQDVKQSDDNSNYDFSSKIETISVGFENTMKFKTLYYSILHYIMSLKSEIKDLEDNSKIVNYNDSNSRLKQKENKRIKLKSLTNLLYNVTKNLRSNYTSYLHRFISYLYYRVNIKKNMIALDTCKTDFDRNFQMIHY